MGSGPKIAHLMLIDDSDIDLFVEQKVVEMAGFASRVSSYISPAEALDSLQKASTSELPDLILLDLNMPVMDGFALLEAISQSPNKILEKLRVIILTSSNSPQDQERAKNYPNVIGFMSKPLTVQSIGGLSLR
ncbi:MAG TPA: response regulator [Cyclobacteriaceae bacterium]|nr:response regulator [Cyclobacteriaceae bacterium]